MIPRYQRTDSAIPENRFCDTTEQILHVISHVARFCFVALEEAMFDFFWGFNFVIIAKSGEDFLAKFWLHVSLPKNKSNFFETS
jgi:hypothetical protein